MELPSEDVLYHVDESGYFTYIENSIKNFFDRSIEEKCTHYRINPINKKLEYYIFNEEKFDEYIDFCGTLNQEDSSLYDLMAIEEYDVSVVNSYKVKSNPTYTEKKMNSESIDGVIISSEIKVVQGDYSFYDLIADLKMGILKIDNLKKCITSNYNNYNINMGGHNYEVSLNWFTPFVFSNINLKEIITKEYIPKDVTIFNNIISNNITEDLSIKTLYKNICNDSQSLSDLLRILGKFSTQNTFTTKLRKYLKENNTNYMCKYKENGKPIGGEIYKKNN